MDKKITIFKSISIVELLSFKVNNVHVYFLIRKAMREEERKERWNESLQEHSAVG